MTLKRSARRRSAAAATARAGEFLEKEFADDPNIKIEWTFFKGAGPAVNEGFANDQLDFAYQGDLPALIGRATGLKTKYLLASGARKPLYLAAAKDSGIKSIEDLKGRKIALQRGTNGHLAAIKILEAHGLTERDVQVVNLDSAGTVAALTSKDIDAAFGDPREARFAVIRMHDIEALPREAATDQAGKGLVVVHIQKAGIIEAHVVACGA